MGTYMNAPVISVFENLPEMILANAFPDTWIIRNEVGDLYMSWGKPKEFRTERKISNKHLFGFIPNGHYVSARELIDKAVPCEK